MDIETNIVTLYGPSFQTAEFYTTFNELTGYDLSDVMIHPCGCYLEKEELIPLSKLVPNTVFEVTQRNAHDTASSWRYTCFNGKVWYEEAKVVFDPPTEFINEIKSINPELFI